MAPRRATPEPRWKRRALAVVLLLVALVGGVLAAQRAGRSGPARDPLRLDLLHSAWIAFDAGRFEEARETLDGRPAGVRPTPLEWMLRARIAEAQGRLAESLDHLKRITDGNPISAKARLKAGQIEMARHRARAAESEFRRSVALDPDQIQAYRELAYLYALQHRYPEFDDQLRSLSRRISLDHVLAFAWCQNFCRLVDPKKTCEPLRRIVAEDPSDRDSRLALAIVYQSMNRREEAEEVLRALPDSDADARAIRIRLAIDHGDIAAAEALATQGTEDNARLNLVRGELALRGGDVPLAQELFRAVLRSEPENRDAIQGLGLAMRKLGDPEAGRWLKLASLHDELKRMIQDAATTLHSDPRLYFKLGALCESLKRLEEAGAWYRLALDREPLDDQARQSLQRVERALRNGEGEPRG